MSRLDYVQVNLLILSYCCPKFFPFTSCDDFILTPYLRRIDLGTIYVVSHFQHIVRIYDLWHTEQVNANIDTRHSHIYIYIISLCNCWRRQNPQHKRTTPHKTRSSYQYTRWGLTCAVTLRSTSLAIRCDQLCAALGEFGSSDSPIMRVHSYVLRV